MAAVKSFVTKNWVLMYILKVTGLLHFAKISNQETKAQLEKCSRFFQLVGFLFLALIAVGNIFTIVEFYR